MAEADPILNRILATRATTVHGLQVKLRAFLYCRCGDPLDGDDFGPGTTATDVRILMSMVDDLGRMVA